MSDSLPKQKKFISISEAANFLGVSIDTVRRWDKSGTLHSVRLDGKNRYFPLAELEEHKSNQPLTISDVARKLSISPTTLRRLETRGLLKPERNNAGERVFSKESIENFLKSDYFVRKNRLTEKAPLAPDEINNDQEINIDKEVLPHQTIKHPDKEVLSKLAEGYSSKNPLEFPEDFATIQTTSFKHRIPEFVGATLIFFLLIGIGVTNINAAGIKNPQDMPTPAVLSVTETPAPNPSLSPVDPPVTIEEIETTEPPAGPAETTGSVEATEPSTGSVEAAEPSAEPEEISEPTEATEPGELKATADDQAKPKVLVIKAEDGAKHVNIRQNPTTEAGIIGKAKNGDTYEYSLMESGWYMVRLSSGLVGFISEEFVEAATGGNE